MGGPWMRKLIILFLLILAGCASNTAGRFKNETNNAFLEFEVYYPNSGYMKLGFLRIGQATPYVLCEYLYPGVYARAKIEWMWFDTQFVIERQEKLPEGFWTYRIVGVDWVKNKLLVELQKDFK